MNVQINRMQRLMLIEGFGELLDTDNRLHDAAPQSGSIVADYCDDLVN
ncbi:hypothetical protein ACVXHA_16725 [Escherichia coli]